MYIEKQKLLSSLQIPSIQTDGFLPPISPWTSLAGVFLVGTVGAAFSLAWSVKYNVTVKASANVRPTGELRLVQPEIEGTVKQIFVKENQIVKQGDRIALLNDEQLQIKKSQVKGNIEQSKLQLIQMYAQIKTLDVQIVAEKRVIEQIISSAKTELARNQREYQEREITTTSDSVAAEANLQKAEVDLQKAKVDLEFAIVDRDRYEQLSQTGAVGRREFEQKKLAVEQVKLTLQSQQKAVDIAKAKIQSTKAALNPSYATVDIAKKRIDQEIAKGEAAIATLLKEKEALIQRRAEIQNQINQSRKDIQQLDTQLKSSIIRATTNGVILKLNVYNPGQVVRTSEPIAQIVPLNAPLVIKAMIPPADIKKVAVDQKVQLRVDACPYPDYGTLKGTVSAISPDAITSGSNSGTLATSSSTAGASYFEVTVKPETLTFGRSGYECHLQAGMAATADIISKQETALQYLLRKARLIIDL
ncbi:secretion protein HlyD [Scytonema sp. HK-05]|uniref:HlyD family efflux transporter periplasmic adaptor subunit n=1 Tax=Scytonema sp. HK-05 TaxID=1137095 RepID=UPI000ADC6CAB|nr:HlyD family efflux transporter periplasmic adaptor subunit [Scytonema sp. HK-05]BAY45791.1 secretion protein HlyD [Scytonema sp. HK-05]